MDEQGLAMSGMGGAQSGPPSRQPVPAAADPLAPQAGGPDEMAAIVEELAQLILQGISPEELINQGVPQEIVEQAMAMAVQLGGGGAPAAPEGPPIDQPMTEPGLAATSYR